MADSDVFTLDEIAEMISKFPEMEKKYKDELKRQVASIWFCLFYYGSGIIGHLLNFRHFRKDEYDKAETKYIFYWIEQWDRLKDKRVGLLKTGERKLKSFLRGLITASIADDFLNYERGNKLAEFLIDTIYKQLTGFEVPLMWRYPVNVLSYLVEFVEPEATGDKFVYIKEVAVVDYGSARKSVLNSMLPFSHVVRFSQSLTDTTTKKLTYVAKTVDELKKFQSPLRQLREMAFIEFFEIDDVSLFVEEYRATVHPALVLLNESGKTPFLHGVHFQMSKWVKQLIWGNGLVRRKKAERQLLGLTTPYVADFIFDGSGEDATDYYTVCQIYQKKITSTIDVFDEIKELSLREQEDTRFRKQDMFCEDVRDQLEHLIFKTTVVIPRFDSTFVTYAIETLMLALFNCDSPHGSIAVSKVFYKHDKESKRSIDRNENLAKERGTYLLKLYYSLVRDMLQNNEKRDILNTRESLFLDNSLIHDVASQRLALKYFAIELTIEEIKVVAQKADEIIDWLGTDFSIDLQKENDKVKKAERKNAFIMMKYINMNNDKTFDFNSDENDYQSYVEETNDNDFELWELTKASAQKINNMAKFQVKMNDIAQPTLDNISGWFEPLFFEKK